MEDRNFLTILKVLANEIELLRYENERLKAALEEKEHE